MHAQTLKLLVGQLLSNRLELFAQIVVRTRVLGSEPDSFEIIINHHSFNSE
jgi:hypothetical protein